MPHIPQLRLWRKIASCRFDWLGPVQQRQGIPFHWCTMEASGGSKGYLLQLTHFLWRWFCRCACIEYVCFSKVIYVPLHSQTCAQCTVSLHAFIHSHSPGLLPAVSLMDFYVIVSSQAKYMCFLSAGYDRTHWGPVFVRRGVERGTRGSVLGSLFCSGLCVHALLRGKQLHCQNKSSTKIWCSIQVRNQPQRERE